MLLEGDDLLVHAALHVSIMTRGTPRKIFPKPRASKSILLSLLAAGWCISRAESWGVSSTFFSPPVSCRGSDVAVGKSGTAARSSGALPARDTGK